MINEDKDVVGFMALNDYPNVDGVDPADWELWIRNMYQLVYLLTLSLPLTLFTTSRYHQQ